MDYTIEVARMRPGRWPCCHRSLPGGGNGQQALSLADGTYHVPPLALYTVERAHEIIRLHIECRSWLCPAKGVALDVLEEAGRLVFDPDRWNER